MADEQKADYIGACALVKIEWNGGATIHRYITALGYVDYDGAIWLDNDSNQGQLLNISDLVEKSNEVSNRDLTIFETATIKGFIDNGTWRKSKVTIIEGNINPQTNAFTAFNTSIYKITDIPFDGGLNQSVTFTLSSDAISNSLIYGDNWTYSAGSQSQLINGATDTGFRYISNKSSGLTGVGASLPIISGGFDLAKNNANNEV